jgi:hypothetical protein
LGHGEFGPVVTCQLSSGHQAHKIIAAFAISSSRV